MTPKEAAALIAGDDPRYQAMVSILDYRNERPSPSEFMLIQRNFCKFCDERGRWEIQDAGRALVRTGQSLFLLDIILTTINHALRIAPSPSKRIPLIVDTAADEKAFFACCKTVLATRSFETALWLLALERSLPQVVNYTELKILTQQCKTGSQAAMHKLAELVEFLQNTIDWDSDPEPALPKPAGKPEWDVPRLPIRLKELANALISAGGKAGTDDISLTFDPSRIYHDYSDKWNDWIKKHIGKDGTGVYIWLPIVKNKKVSKRRQKKTVKLSK